MATEAVWITDRVKGLGGSLSRLGKLAFWVQLIFLTIVLLLSVYTLSLGGSGNRARLGNFLAFLVMALPVFTTYWCYRYSSVGGSLSESPSAAKPAGVLRRLWTGVWAGTIGVLASLLSLFGAASALLVTMLANPQIGLQVSPATGEATSYTISAIDGVSIMSLLLALTAELIVVFVSLRLIFITYRASIERN